MTLSGFRFAMTSQGPPELHLRNEADLDLAFFNLLRQVYAGERWALVEPHAARVWAETAPFNSRPWVEVRSEFASLWPEG